MTSVCYIFGAGPFYGLVEPPGEDDYILAADGGYQHCHALGLRPHWLLGDFDSLDALPEGIKTKTFPVEKDDTDTMLALKTGLTLGCHTFHLYGGTGGRMDHTLANLQALGWLAERGAQGFLYDEHYTFTAIRNGTLTLPTRAEGIFSVFCLGREAQGVTIQGGQYPTNHIPFSPTYPLGVSNHFQGNAVTISVEDGCLLVGWERP